MYRCMEARNVISVLAFAISLPSIAAQSLSVQNGSYTDCPGTPPDWFPECWAAVHARIQVGGDRVFYWTPHTSQRWGNVLSPYWQARALAILAGHGFNAYVGFDAGWLKHLPKETPAVSCPQIDKFDAACNQCDSESWSYAHRCAGAWTWIRPTIINDTHAAFAAWAVEKGLQLPQFNSGDVVIQSRCSRDTILRHPEYGPVAFSFYKHISSGARRIVIVTDLLERTQLCADIHAAQVRWLKAQYPAADVLVEGDNVHQDFAKLLLAPVLFKDAQSSFGLWAALANKGEVWSVPFLRAYTNNTHPDLGPNWHWSDSPVLYPHIAKQQGISLDKPQGIIHWLENN